MRRSSCNGTGPRRMFLTAIGKASDLFRRDKWQDSCDSCDTRGTTIDQDEDQVQRRERHGLVGQSIIADCCNPQSAPSGLMRTSGWLLSSTDKTLPSELVMQRMRASIRSRTLTLSTWVVVQIQFWLLSFLSVTGVGSPRATPISKGGWA